MVCISDAPPSQWMICKRISSWAFRGRDRPDERMHPHRKGAAADHPFLPADPWQGSPPGKEQQQTIHFCRPTPSKAAPTPPLDCSTIPMGNGDWTDDQRREFLRALQVFPELFEEGGAVAKLDEKSKPLTALTTPDGAAYEFQVMPFGLKGAPTTFQKLMV
ncbi:hypothetical protein QE152_g22249 [Popillia japonica]|uniref:Reverse transcriptase/retrotransposon-derived protein RNase H-like domain-containing protein n=1 Tax=Popillia japonica TaxID=7064 RepID=A0AAW1KLH5_POPJA